MMRSTGMGLGPSRPPMSPPQAMTRNMPRPGMSPPQPMTRGRGGQIGGSAMGNSGWGMRPRSPSGAPVMPTQPAGPQQMPAQPGSRFGVTPNPVMQKPMMIDKGMMGSPQIPQQIPQIPQEEPTFAQPAMGTGMGINDRMNQSPDQMMGQAAGGGGLGPQQDMMQRLIQSMRGSKMMGQMPSFNQLY